MGKALLAFSTPHDQRAILHRIAIERFTPNTLVDPELLLADLALTRARGYAISNGEHVEGVVSVAAPVFDHTGKAIGAIGMFGPSSRNPVERLHDFGRDLMEAARLISGNVGAPSVSIHSRKAPVRGADARVECVLPWSASLAEGPFWSVSEQRLYWVDILEPAVHRFDPASGGNETCPFPPREFGDRAAIRRADRHHERRGGGTGFRRAPACEAREPGSDAARKPLQRCEMRSPRAPLGGHDEP